jgi:broad specificity phosphatase PhoE
VTEAGAPATAASGWLPPSEERTRLVLVRHGATEHSALRRFSGRNDLPLAPVGERQAAALAARDLSADVGPVSTVVSSPLRRCRQTAAAVAGAGGHDVTVLDDLAETDFGRFEGLTFAEAGHEHPDAFAAWTASPEVAPPGGESFAAVDVRTGRARETLLARYPGSTVVVVTHVTPIKLLVRHALEAPLEVLYRLHLDTASVSVVDLLPGGRASLRLFNDTSHLRGLQVV